MPNLLDEISDGLKETYRQKVSKDFEATDEDLDASFIKRKKEMEENTFIFKNLTSLPEEIKAVKLTDIYDKYKQYLHIEDTKRIDVTLAVALSSKIEGIPIWLILVGASGDMKSAQLNAIRTKNIALLHNLTSKTLVNGYKDKIKYPDLAPTLHNKIIIIPDMAQLLKLPPAEKGELWGQLRDLYDGYAGKMSGMGSTAQYEGIKTTLLAGSTPVIDGQILIHQDLGTRELIYRTSGNIEKEKVMKQCFDNEEREKQINQELKEITSSFIEQRKVKREFIPPEIEKQIMQIAMFVTYMRASAEIDSYSNELRSDVYPEEPTRIAKQMKRLYVCLMSLADDYPNERAIEILWHTARSSAFQIRIQIFDLLKGIGKELSTSQVAELLQIGKGTAQRDLNIMWNMGLVNCRKQETSYPDRFYDYWTLNEDEEFVKNYQAKPSVYI